MALTKHIPPYVDTAEYPVKNPIGLVFTIVVAVHIFIYLGVSLLGKFTPADHQPTDNTGIIIDFSVMAESSVNVESDVPCVLPEASPEPDPKPAILPEPEPEPDLPPEPDTEPQKVLEAAKPKKAVEAAKPKKAVEAAKPRPIRKPKANTCPQPDSAVASHTPSRAVSTASSGSQGNTARGEAIVVRRVKPSYPSTSRRRGEEGRVVLNVLVQSNGSAGAVSVKKSSGFSRLDKAAANAVRQWRFEPYKLNGSAVNHEYSIVVNFSLSDS